MVCKAFYFPKNSKYIKNLCLIAIKFIVAESIKVAEAAKIIENTQRDINISLMNEFQLYVEIEYKCSDVPDAASINGIL